MSRGQAFSMDFITASLLIIVSLAIVMHAIEFSARSPQSPAQVLSPLFLSYPDQCTTYHGQNDACSSLSCNNTLVYRRLVLCEGKPCLKEVVMCR